jgi:hypothetical protein
MKNTSNDWLTGSAKWYNETSRTERYQRSAGSDQSAPLLTQGHIMATGQSTTVFSPVEIPESEEWRLCLGGYYEVSSLGRIRRVVPRTNTRAGQIISLKMNRTGYWCFTASCNAVKFHRTVHRVVCEAFNGPPPAPGLTVNHKSGVKTDNRPANLEWATQAENEAHATANGLKAIGARNWNAKLTPEAVQNIRRRRAGKGRKNRTPVRVLMAEYGVCKATIDAAVFGRYWRHLETEQFVPQDAPEPLSQFACDICDSRVGTRMIEQRISWGISIGMNKGYSGRPIPWCKACRTARGATTFRYATEEGGV